MTVRIAEQPTCIDPSNPIRDHNGHLIGIGDQVTHVCGTDLATVIGTVIIGGERNVRSKREYAGTYATLAAELVVKR